MKLLSLSPCRAAERRPSTPSRLAVRRAGVMVGLAFAVIVRLAGAAPTTPGTTEFFTRTWQVDQGLPHDAVNRVVQDERGYLWTATVGGLARFDGLEFREYPLATDDEDAGLNIRDLVRIADGTMAMLPAGGGVMRVTPAGFTPHPASAATERRSLVRLHPEPGGALWFGTSGGEVLRWAEGTLEAWGEAAGIQRRTGAPYSWAGDAQGGTWVAVGDFLGRYAAGQLVRAATEAGSRLVIAPSRDGSLWLASEQRLGRWRDRQLTPVCDGAAWRATYGEIETLHEDHAGALWIGTRRAGVFRWHDGTLTRVLPLPHAVTALTTDDEGNLWVASDGGGLSRLRPKEFLLLDSAAGFPADITLSVTEDATGALWCANRSGLLRWKDGRTTLVTVPGFEDLVPGLVCADQAGWVWFSGGGAIFRMRSDDPEQIEPMGDLGPIYALHATRGGDVWVALARGGLGFFREGRFHPLTAADGLTGRRVGALAEAGDGTLWIAMHDHLLFTYQAGRLEAQPAASEALTGRIHVLHFDSRGALWLGTSRGLVRQQDGVRTRFTRDDGLQDDIIDQILEDGAGRLWLGSRRGLFRVALDDLDARAAGGRAPVRTLALGRDEGLTGTSSLRGGPPAAWRARDGRLWFTTNRGLVGLAPQLAEAPQRAPRVYVEDVVLDGHRTPARTLTVDADSTSPLGEGNVDLPAPATAPLRLPPSVAQVQFRFTALHFSAPEKVSLRHRLDGLDRDWIDLGGRRSATYARLPPGDYTLRVQASDQQGRWSEPETSLGLIVVPAWWQTWWARTLLGVGGVAAAISLGRAWALRRVRERLARLEHAQALAQERARIARDLHDELGGSVTQLGLLAERLKRHASEPTTRAGLDQLAGHTRQLTSELERVVWTVSPKNDSWDRLALFIGQLAGRFFRETGVSCTVTGLADIPAVPLAPEAQHHVLSIVKEALNNLLRHARAQHVTLALTAEAEGFALQLADDGVGFDPAAPEHAERNGLNNLRTRAAELGGSLVLASQPGHGTVLTLRVPWHALQAPAQP